MPERIASGSSPAVDFRVPPAWAAPLVVLLLASVCPVSASGKTATAAFQEFLFRTPSRNIYCSAFEWDSLQSGMIQCVVLSTRTPHLNPKEWLLEPEGSVSVFRPEDAPISNNKVVPYGTTLRLGLFRCTS